MLPADGKKSFNHPWIFAATNQRTNQTFVGLTAGQLAPQSLGLFVFRGDSFLPLLALTRWGAAPVKTTTGNNYVVCIYITNA